MLDNITMEKYHNTTNQYFPKRLAYDIRRRSDKIQISNEIYETMVNKSTAALVIDVL